ncbi:hypothetical protein D3C75_1061480 [compost metagenome]
MQVVAIGAEVVVDHVEDDGQPMAVGAVDQMLELFGRAVGGLGCVGQDAVVAPVAITGKLRQGHQLDGGDAQPGQACQMLFDAVETTQGAHVQFVDYGFVPGATGPLGVSP